MLFHVQHHVQVPRRTAIESRLPLAGVAHAHTVFHTCRNLHLERALLDHAAFATALRTRIVNHLSRATTRRTSTRDGEESLLIAHLAAPTAGATLARRFPWRDTRPVTVLTTLVLVNLNVHRGA